MYCKDCGKELPPGAEVCIYCGSKTSFATTKALRTAAKIIMLLGVISTFFSGIVLLFLPVFWLRGLGILITLAWQVPMTVSYWKNVHDGMGGSTGFKVCTLIFVSTISGILMLCDKED